tara:strand:+ start:340 stop:744 length:405 start_codon:yes stop_codon:yes gene_type:complete
LKEKRILTVDGEEFEVEIELKEGLWEVSVEGKTYSIKSDSVSKVRPRKKKSSGKLAGGSGIVTSAIPGKVVSILVSEGDTVAAGDVVIVLEAMKMQNEIKAAIGGLVKKVGCESGERVEANVPLLEIEKIEDVG